MKLFAVVLASTFALGAVACGKKGPEAGGTAPAGGTAAPAGGEGGGDLPAACKKFLESYAACAEKAGPAAGAMKDGAKTMQDAWSKVPKDQMEAACKASLDSVKGSMGAVCPDVKWE